MAVKAPSPLLGFNNNVRHKGRVFHIQTEDSGVRHPHVITHLFADGGRILKTTKTSYAEHIGQDRMAETVRQMMQEQHKAMFIALRDGQFDYLFDEHAANAHATASQQVKQATPSTPGTTVPKPPAQPAAKAPTPAAARPLVEHEEPAPLSPTPPAPVAMGEPPKPPARPVTMGETPKPPARPVAMGETLKTPGVTMGDPERVPQTPPAQSVALEETPRPVTMGETPKPPARPAAADITPPSRKRPPSRPRIDVDDALIHGATAPAMPQVTGSIDLDLDALERAAVEAQTPFYQQIQDLPPPPAAVLGSKRPSPGSYSVRESAKPAPFEASSTPKPSFYETPKPLSSPRRTSPRVPQSPPPPQPSPARYAPSRPASIFATTRPQEGSSIFGEDLISEKSLDEVILSYLAEDLDAPGEKK